jgi:thioredoxin reductase (NADPH)
MFLSRAASHVHVLVRGRSLAAGISSWLIERLTHDPAITIHDETEMVAIKGGDHLTGITLRNRATGAERRVATRAVFVMVGAAPNTGWLAGHCALDRAGFVRTGAAAGVEGTHATSCPGFFAVGAVRAGSVKQVESAVGEGSVVIPAVWAHVNAGA